MSRYLAMALSAVFAYFSGFSAFTQPMPPPPKLERAHYAHLDQAVRAGRAPVIMVVGSSSTVGLGASTPDKAYVARLAPHLHDETRLEFRVIGRGVNGETAQGSANRMRQAIDDVRPDLVIWQVGTNDALNKVAPAGFGACLKATLAFLRERGVDVLLVNPQYIPAIAEATPYQEIVNTISEMARSFDVPVVDRFGVMKRQQAADRVSYLSSDHLHMNDRGHELLAEQLVGAIAAHWTPGGVRATLASAERVH